jgi:hypothetical protein
MKRLKLIAAAVLAASSLPALAVGTLADVRVFDRAQGTELPVYWHEGKAYVVGRPGNEYSISVRNQAGQDLLAVMSVDGVNVLSGETANTRQGGYIVSSWESLDVKGWRKSLQDTAAFYVTSLGASYAARTGRPNAVGVIGVALYKRKYEPPRQSEWSRRDEFARGRSESAPAPASPPSMGAQDSAGSLAKRAAPGAPIGTGHGRREESPVHYVDFQRATSYPVETITIHYDSYRNLVARGVLQQPVARRDPQPFPGFVPDPVGWSPYR